MKALAEAMRSMSKCLIDVEDHTKISSVKELFVYITRILRDAALFIEIYQMKSGLGEFASKFYMMKIAYGSASLQDNLLGRNSQRSWETTRRISKQSEMNLHAP